MTAAAGRPAPAQPTGAAQLSWVAITAVSALIALLAAGTAALTVLVRQNALANGGQTLVVAIPFTVIGIVVARRQPRNPVGWALTAIGGLVLLGNDGSLYALLAYRLGYRLPLAPAAVLLDVSWEPAVMLLPLAILLFPDGVLPSARWRWVLRAYLALSISYLAILYEVAIGAIAGHHVIVDANGGLAAVDFPAGWLAGAQHVILLLYVVCWLAFVLRQVQAWRHAGGERRQQLKWLASGAAVSMAAVTFNVVGPAADPSAFAVMQAVGVIAGIFIAALPVSIGVGILKYRLYDIDRIISRTLAYAILTGLYAGLVLLATQVLPLSTPVAVAAATLAAAAAFNPLRRRVQRLVDRRFNRARYDADTAITAFAARLQGAVDLGSVRDDLLTTAQAALEPAHLALWLAAGTGLAQAPANPPPGAV